MEKTVVPQTTKLKCPSLVAVAFLLGDAVGIRNHTQWDNHKSAFLYILAESKRQDPQYTIDNISSYTIDERNVAIQTNDDHIVIWLSEKNLAHFESAGYLHNRNCFWADEKFINSKMSDRAKSWLIHGYADVLKIGDDGNKIFKGIVKYLDKNQKKINILESQTNGYRHVLHFCEIDGHQFFMTVYENEWYDNRITEYQIPLSDRAFFIDLIAKK